MVVSSLGSHFQNSPLGYGRPRFLRGRTGSRQEHHVNCKIRSATAVSILLGSHLPGIVYSSDDAQFKNPNTERRGLRHLADNSPPVGQNSSSARHTGFSDSAFRLVVSERLLQNLISQPVDRVAPVRQNILGTDVVGTGRTRGQVGVDFVPNNAQATIRLFFQGTTTTNAYGLTGRVKSTSVSETTILSHANLSINRDGIATTTARASARSNLQVCRVNILPAQRIVGRLLPPRLIERQAWKSIAKTRRQRENIIATQAERTAERRMNERLPPLARTADRKLNRWLLQPFGSLDRSSRELRFSTTNDYLIVAHQPFAEEPNRIANATFPMDGQLASISLHETVAAQLLNRYLAGIHLPAAPSSSEDADPGIFRAVSAVQSKTVKVQFAHRNPVSIEFGDRCLRLRVRGDQLVVSGMDTGQFEIDLQLCCERLQHGVRLRSLRMPRISFAAAQSASPWRTMQSHALKMILMASCNRDLLLEGVELPALSGRTCRVGIQGVTCQDGWLHLSFGECTTAPAVEPPADSDQERELLKVATTK